MNNMICNRCEEMDLLIPYIDKPVYIKGYYWNRSFDGWVVIYEIEKSWLTGRNLVFDYRGKQYSVYDFLSRYTMWTNSTYNNAFYKGEVINGNL